jgi:hypothetical protein
MHRRLLRPLAVVLSTTLALALAVLSACEQRYSGDAPANTPVNAPATSSTASLAAVLALDATDAGSVALSTSHAMIVTNCGWPTHPCGDLDTSASADGNYRVTFGSGHASIRSRGQAMSDLYRELRDKTSAGQQLDIEARSPSASGPSTPTPPGAAHRGGSNDPITMASFVVLDLVDNIGEADVDAVYGTGSDQCVIALGRALGAVTAKDAGAGSCLMREPERPKRIPLGTGLSW